MFEAGSDPVSVAALAREAADKDKRKKVVDLRAVRARFKHLRNRPSPQPNSSEPVRSQSEPVSQLEGSVGAPQQQSSRLGAAGSSNTIFPQSGRPGSADGASLRQVQICADSVCSLQVLIPAHTLITDRIPNFRGAASHPMLTSSHQ